MPFYVNKERHVMRSIAPWTFALSVLLFAAQTPRAGAETFKFKSEVRPEEFTATIGGELSFPTGTGPFPVVVFMHACGGLDRFALASFASHARYLRSAGFAALILDSFSVRNMNGGKACAGPPATNALGIRFDDAFNAIDALRKHPKVSQDNVFLVGQSHGGIVAVWGALGATKREQFRALAAYYPSCSALLHTAKLTSPLIVFVGAKDDWTPSETCVRAKETKRDPGAEFELVVYPNAFHAFDQPREPTKYKGYTLVYDQKATADSQRRVKEFFIRHLTDELRASPRFSRGDPK